MRCAALALVLLALTRPASAAVVDVRDAADYVGSAVTIEGDVADVKSESMGIVLELAPGGPTSVRAVLVEALISSLPRSPEKVYGGKRVRVTGILQKFKGRLELILESPSQVEIVDVAGAPPVTTTTITPTASPTTTITRPAPVTTPTTLPTPPPAAAPPSEPAPAPITTPPPPPPPAPAAPTPPAPAPQAVPPPPPPAPPATTPPSAAEEEPRTRPLLTERLAEQACNRARSRWQDAATKARDASAALTRCLDANSYNCHPQAAALVPVLSDLEWAEQQVAEKCD